MAGTGAEAYGWRRVLDSTTSQVGVYSGGQKRFEIGNTTLTTEGANTAALLHGIGTTTTPVSIGTTADKNFIGYWMKSTATSGDTRGMYLRLYLSAAGSGEALRAYTTCDAANVATGGTANGAHISLNITGSGTISGAANALRATLDIAASVTPGGTISSIQVDSNFGASAVVPATAAFFHLDNVGSAPTTNGMPLLFNILNADTTTFFVTATNTVIDHALKISIDGTAYYIGLYDAVTG